MEENQPIPNPEPIKKEKKGCPLALVIILAILAVGGIGFGVFELLNKNEQTNCITTQLQEKEPENPIGENTNKQEETPETESTYIDPPSSNDFSEEIQKKIMEFRIVQNSNPDDEFQYMYQTPIWQANNESYYLIPTPNGWSIFNSKATEEKIIKTQSDTIKHVRIGRFGLDDGGTNLLFINNNNQVEFLHLYDAFENEKFETTLITDLKNIIRFETVGHHQKNTIGGGLTTLAEDKDGNYYNLAEYVFKD